MRGYYQKVSHLDELARTCQEPKSPHPSPGEALALLLTPLLSTQFGACPHTPLPVTSSYGRCGEAAAGSSAAPPPSTLVGLDGESLGILPSFYLVQKETNALRFGSGPGLAVVAEFAGQ